MELVRECLTGNVRALASILREAKPLRVLSRGVI